MVVQKGSLDSVPAFAGLASAELDAISRVMVQREAERGKIIATEGEPALALYTIVSGAVRTFITSSDGKEQFVNIVRPGESFNEASVFNGGINLTSAQAIGAVMYNEISRQDFRAIVSRYPEITSNLLEIMANQVHLLTSLVGNLLSSDTIQKVARVLLETVNDRSDKRQKLSQQDMAAAVGTSRGMIGRSLDSLRSNGVIAIDHNRLVIKDKKKLEMWCSMNG